MAGSIECGDEAIDCNVRNLSETGAALEVLSPLYIPDRFTLVVRSDQLKRACQVIWRKGKRIGVRSSNGSRSRLRGELQPPT